MSDLTTQAQEAQSGGGKGLAIVFLSILYSVVNDLTSNLEFFFEGSRIIEESISIGIFVPASASIIFGRGIGAISGGIGELLIEFTNIFQGESDLDAIHIGTLVNSISIGLGAWLTGFLGKENTKDETPETFKELVASWGQLRKIGTDVLAAIVGLAVFKNFLYAYGSQLQENASLSGGTGIFLQYFISDTLVMMIVLPVTLIAYDSVQVFLKKRDKIIEQLLLDVDTKIETEEGIKITNVALPNGVLVQGKWTLVKISFQNMLSEALPFHLDAVSTSRMYPDTDNTSIIEPGGSWVQSFYILPSKQKTVNLRVRITPKTAETYKNTVEHQATVEINAKTKNPSNMTASLLGFGGVNFGIVGISATWDRIIATLGNPGVIINQISRRWEIIVTTIVAELLLFIPLIYVMYRRSRVSIDDASLESWLHERI